MKEAVEDHRASSKTNPRSIYGKIVSSADRGVIVDVAFKRTFMYRVRHKFGMSLEDMIEDSRLHLKGKYGKTGYAREKMYFEDKDYIKYLDEISILCDDRFKFRQKFLEVNQVEIEKYINDLRGN